MSFRGFLNKTSYKVKEAAPAIYMVAGIVGFVGTVVLACHETTKASKIIEKHKEDLNDINSTFVKASPEEYNDEDMKKDKFIVTAQMCVSFVKLYSPSIILGSLSIMAFLRSYNLLKSRYLAASALASALAESFNAYRGRVRDKYGEEIEEKLYFGTEEVDVTTIDGKKEKHEKVDMFIYTDNIPVYAKFFDESCKQWNKNPELNLMFLKGVEIRMNDLFNETGHLFLNQVYRALDIPETEIGNEVGWFSSHGDQVIDFGIFNGDEERKRAFVNGYEPSILLSFNCVPKMPGDLPKY